MRSPRIPYLLMLLLLTMAFSVAGWVEPRYQAREEAHSGDMMSFLLGDSRRLFANQPVVPAKLRHARDRRQSHLRFFGLHV